MSTTYDLRLTYYIKILFFLPSLLFLIVSCDNHELVESSQSQQSTSLKSSSGVKLKTYLPEKTKTVLGEIKQNPYSVDNMTAAAEEIIGHKIDRFSPTDFYVSFEPENVDQFTRLDESGLLLFDYPLDRQVLVQGDHYIPLTEYEQGYPKFYTSVPANYAFPEDIPYEIIEEIYFPEYIPKDLVFFGYKKAGFDVEELTQGDYSDCCENPCSELCCPNWPACTGLGPDASIEEYMQACAGATTIDGLLMDLDCFDEEPPTFDPPNNDDDLTRACGCNLNADERKPSGCVTYENTVTGFEGVPNVEIYSVHPWAPLVIFNPVNIALNIAQGDEPLEEDEWETESTNEFGCFKFDRKHPRNLFIFERYDFWLKFQNSDVKVRNGLWPWVHKTKVINQEGGDLNDLQIEVTQDDEVAWLASHVLDSDYEYREFCGDFGITQPHDNLNIILGLLLEEQGTAGVAAMLEKGGFVEGQGLYACFEPDGAAFDLTLEYFTPQFTALLWGGWYVQPALEIVPLPDVIFRRGINNSRRFQELNYHEFGHASLYREVGEPFWKDIRKHAVANLGDGMEPFAQGVVFNCSHPDLVAMNEGFAEHLGRTFENEKFGGNLATNLENLFLDNMFIPVGLPWDLIDNNNDNNDIPLVTPVTDNVAGYTDSEIFDVLTTSASWAEALQELATNANEAEIEQLKVDYGL